VSEGLGTEDDLKGDARTRFRPEPLKVSGPERRRGSFEEGGFARPLALKGRLEEFKSSAFSDSPFGNQTIFRGSFIG
jgi:hypothetical protein